MQLGQSEVAAPPESTWAGECGYLGSSHCPGPHTWLAPSVCLPRASSLGHNCHRPSTHASDCRTPPWVPHPTSAASSMRDAGTCCLASLLGAPRLPHPIRRRAQASTASSPNPCLMGPTPPVPFTSCLTSQPQRPGCSEKVALDSATAAHNHGFFVAHGAEVEPGRSRASLNSSASSLSGA